MARVAVRSLGQPLKNYLINSDFSIWQRNVGTAGPFTEDTSYAYKGPDRWRHRFDDLVASSTVRQWARVNDAPVTVEPSVLGQSAFRHIFRRGNTGVWVSYLGQRIESFVAQEMYNNNPSGKVSVAIWVKSDTATSITLNLYSATAQDNFSSETTIHSSSKTFTANSTWQQVKWEGIATTAQMVNGVECLFTVTTPAAVGADGADKEIRLSMAQLNKGEVIETFSTYGVSFPGELTACQRYYEKTYGTNVTVGAVGDQAGMIVTRIDNTSVTNNGTIDNMQFRVKKRTTPTVTIYSYNGVAGRVSDSGGVDQAAGSGNTGFVGSNGFRCVNNSGGTLTTNDILWHWTAEAEI